MEVAFLCESATVTQFHLRSICLKLFLIEGGWEYITSIYK